MENTSRSSDPTTDAANIPNTSGGNAVNPNTSASPSTATSIGPVQDRLRMLNRNSHKISKHVTKQHQPITSTNPNPTSAAPIETTTLSTPAPNLSAPPQPQPPVYNINKNDFRDVVQKLTGSAAHPNAPRASAPPTNSPSSSPPNRPATGAATSRLHKIRPPPLSYLGPRPDTTATAGGVGGNMWMRPSMTTPNSPLPAFPSVSAAAESPITAYMRCLHSGGVDGSQQQQSPMIPWSPGLMGMPLFPLPTSPLGIGCLPSPRSAYQTLLPPSPNLPMPSPKCKEE